MYIQIARRHRFQRPRPTLKSNSNEISTTVLCARSRRFVTFYNLHFTYQNHINMMSHQQPAMDNTTPLQRKKRKACTPQMTCSILLQRRVTCFIFKTNLTVSSLSALCFQHEVTSVAAMRQKATKFGFFVIDRGMAACCSETTSRDAANAKKSSPGNWFPRKMGKPTYQCMTFTFKHRAGAAAGQIFWTYLGRGPAAGQKPGRPYPSAVMPYLAAPICAY
jgi:hypothetical protein